MLGCRAAAGGQSTITVFVGSHAGLVKAVDLMSGAVLWQVQLTLTPNPDL